MAYLFPYAGQPKNERMKHPYHKLLEKIERAKRRNLPTHAPRAKPVAPAEPPTPPIAMEDRERFAGAHEFPPSLRKIIMEVCKEHDVSISDIAGVDSRKHVVQARRAYCVRAKMETTHSFVRIARSIGKDHTTAIYFVDQVLNKKYSLKPVRNRTTAPPLGVRRKPYATEPTALEREFQLLAAQGMPIREIAVKMGKSTSAVRHYRKRLAKKAILREELADELG